MAPDCKMLLVQSDCMYARLPARYLESHVTLCCAWPSVSHQMPLQVVRRRAHAETDETYISCERKLPGWPAPFSFSLPWRVRNELNGVDRLMMMRSPGYWSRRDKPSRCCGGRRDGTGSGEGGEMQLIVQGACAKLTETVDEMAV